MTLSSIEAFLDIAQVVDTSEGPSLRLAGWTFATEGQVVAVQAWAGETPLGHIPYGFPRPDVSRHFHEISGSRESGFAGQVKLPPGTFPLATTGLKMIVVTNRLEKRELPVTAQASNPAQEWWLPNANEFHPVLPAKPGNATPAILAAPNFFILGAGKCGTTSLYHALRQHPQIHMPAVKEPSFFSEGFQVVSNPVEYFNLFPAHEAKKRYGEASHVYFSAPETAPILRQLFPEAKFIVILRNPVNRSYSLYQHMRRFGDEPLETFEQALEAEETRFIDPDFKNTYRQYFWNFMYSRSSLFDQQLGRYLHHFSPRQFFVLTLGEWKSGPQLWLKRIFHFLDVDSSVEVNTQPQNEAGGYAPLAEQTRERLAMRFQGMRERVESMIGRELDHWEY